MYDSHSERGRVERHATSQMAAAAMTGSHARQIDGTEAQYAVGRMKTQHARCLMVELLTWTEPFASGKTGMGSPVSL